MLMLLDGSDPFFIYTLAVVSAKAILYNTWKKHSGGKCPVVKGC